MSLNTKRPKSVDEIGRRRDLPMNYTLRLKGARPIGEAICTIEAKTRRSHTFINRGPSRISKKLTMESRLRNRNTRDEYFQKHR